MEEYNHSNAQLDEISRGLNQMLLQIGVDDFVITNNGQLTKSLGIMEDKINDLIAAKD